MSCQKLLILFVTLVCTSIFPVLAGNDINIPLRNCQESPFFIKDYSNICCPHISRETILYINGPDTTVLGRSFECDIIKKVFEITTGKDPKAKVKAFVFNLKKSIYIHHKKLRIKVTKSSSEEYQLIMTGRVEYSELEKMDSNGLGCCWPYLDKAKIIIRNDEVVSCTIFEPNYIDTK